MGDYLPHTDDEVAAMLAFLGLDSLDELFAAVPAALRLAGGLDLADGVPEPDVLAHLEDLADANRARTDAWCASPAAAPTTTRSPRWSGPWPGARSSSPPTRPTSPRWPRASCRRSSSSRPWWPAWPGCRWPTPRSTTGRAPLVEAVNLGVAASGRPTVWVSAGVHPHWRAVLATFAAGTGHHLVEVALRDGRTAWPEPPGAGGAPGVVVVGYPNYLGCLEDLAAARRLCDRHGALLVVAADPVAAGILRSPGEWGADVVVGEGQPFGTALGFGGPYLGLFACTLDHVRRLPGRLVGETVDIEGRRAYVTTLRAREQDIRREKATSNVCTNQTLMAVTAAVQLGWLGTTGLAEVALRCARGRPLRPRGAARPRRGDAAHRRDAGGPRVRRAHPGAGPGGGRADGRRGLPGRDRPG